MSQEISQNVLSGLDKNVSVQCRDGKVLEGKLTECRLPWFVVVDHEHGRQVLKTSEVDSITVL